MTSRTLTLSMASIALFAWSLPASSQGNPIPTATHPENSPEAVAVVNGEPLYAEDIELLLGRVHTGAPENQRTDFDFERLLFRIVNDALLAQEARALGLQKDEPIPKKLEQQRIGLALSHFEQEKVWKDLTVTEDETRALFDEGYSSATFHVLTTRSREEAEAARQDLENGEEFESVAKRSSIDGFRGRGGQVSNVHYIDLPAAISPELFRLEPDQIAGPILSDLGWTVMQAESFEEADPAKYPIVRRFLERVIRERKAEAKRAEIAEQLRRTHPVQIHQDVLSAIGQERLPTSRIVARSTIRMRRLPRLELRSSPPRSSGTPSTKSGNKSATKRPLCRAGTACWMGWCKTRSSGRSPQPWAMTSCRVSKDECMPKKETSSFPSTSPPSWPPRWRSSPRSSRRSTKKTSTDFDPRHNSIWVRSPLRPAKRPRRWPN